MSFRFRLLISFSLLIAVTFGLGGTLLITTSFHSILNQEKATAINEYETIHNNLSMLEFFVERSSYETMANMLSQMEEQQIAHWQAISLCTEHNYTIYQSGDQSLLSANLSVQNEKQYAMTFIIDEKGRRLQLYSELKSQNERLFLKASFDISTAYYLRENQQHIFLIMYMIVVFLGIGIASILSYVLTKRMTTLKTTVKEIASGDVSKRTNLKTGDEFEQLSKDIDSMTDKLQEHIFRLKDDVQRQEAFMGAVAHELKTPLTSIIGYADLIRQCALDENERMMAANYIYTEGQRLEKLSHKILDLLLLEKDAFSMKEVMLDIFLENIMPILMPMAEKKQVKLVWQSDSVSIKIEPDLVKSLLYNLVDNAIKATPSGGTVSIKGQEASSGVTLEIADEGCGMEESELLKITDAFYRVDKSRSREQGGVGLGLTLCKKIVDLHQGTMTFYSKKGKGTCVTIVFHFEKEFV